MIIKTIKTIMSVLLFMGVISCSEQSSEVEPCPMTVDSVTIIDTKQVSGKTYYLVHRIAGWSDKTEILELYDAKPEFNHCSKSNIEPVFGDSLELTQAVSHVYLNLNDKILEIEYQDVSDEKIDNTHLKIELR